MKKNVTTQNGSGHPAAPAKIAMLGLSIILTVSGCQTSQPHFVFDEQAPNVAAHAEAITLREGDILKISFPGAPNLNTTQQIRRDGKIVLPLVGEVIAVGLAPAELEQQLLKLYASELLSKEVTVAVESSNVPVFVTGAVIKPGKILSDRPITALEAIMEAGGFDYAKANLKAVVVVRNENGRIKNYTLNLKGVLQGTESEPFYLKPSDIVYVKEKFAWF
jgi:polysaccharide export outer membrane protein